MRMRSSKVVLAWDERYAQFERESPTTSDILERIAALDGAARTLVTIHRKGAHLAIGGAAPDRLVVYCTFDNEVFWQLVASEESTHSVTIVAGGQAGSYGSRYVTTVEAATTAAAYFLQHGALARTLSWDK